MILLDTNVVSEVMMRLPSEVVLAWLDSQESSGLYLCTITIAEIGYGLQILPEGERQRSLGRRFKRFVSQGFGQRVLDFDSAAAHEYGVIMAHRRSQGRPLSAPDGQIAAIAKSREMAVATRNVRDFEDCGLKVINPWG